MPSINYQPEIHWTNVRRSSNELWTLFSFVDDDALAVLSKCVRSSSRYRQVYKVGFDQFCCLEESQERKAMTQFQRTSSLVITWLHSTRFVLETRKLNGDFYLPKTLHQLLCGLLQCMRDVNPGSLIRTSAWCSGFPLSPSAHDWSWPRDKVCQLQSWVLTRDDRTNIGRVVLWVTRKPRALQNAVFYVVGKMFSLCGSVKMRQLKISQINRHTNPDEYVYMEFVVRTQEAFKHSLCLTTWKCIWWSYQTVV